MAQQHQLHAAIRLNLVVASAGLQFPELLQAQLAGGGQPLRAQRSIEARAFAVHHVEALSAEDVDRPCELKLPHIVGHNAGKPRRMPTHARMELRQLLRACYGRQHEHRLHIRILRQCLLNRRRRHHLRLPVKHIRAARKQGPCIRKPFALRDEQLLLRRHICRHRLALRCLMHNLRARSLHRRQRIAAQAVEHARRHKRLLAVQRERFQDIRRAAHFGKLLHGAFLIERALLRTVNRLLAHGLHGMPVRIAKLEHGQTARHRRQRRGKRNARVFLRHDRADLRHLCGVRQPVHRVAGSASARRNAHRRLRTASGVVARIRQVDLLFAAHLQSVAVIQVFLQQHLGQRAAHSGDPAYADAPMARALPAHQRRIAAAHDIALRKAAAVEDLLEFPYGLFARPVRHMRLRRVQRFSICPGDHADILRALHASLQLEGIDACVAHLRDSVNQHQIARGEQIAARPVVQTVRQTARLSAASAVAAPSADHAGKQALAGYRHAQRTVSKRLDLHAGIRHALELRQRAFARRHHTRKAEIAEQLRALRVVDRHLRAGMQRQLRKALPGDANHAQILHDGRVHAGANQQLKHIAQVVHLALLDQRIDGHIDLSAPLVRVLDRFLELLIVKIARIAARAESCIAQIDGVCAAGNSRHERLAVARRG